MIRENGESSQKFRAADGRFVKIGENTWGGFKKGVPNGPPPQNKRRRQKKG